MVGDSKKKGKKKKSQVPFRLNILFIGVFLLFTVLILRLGVVQIVNGEQYVKQTKEKETKTTQLDAARGKIFDRKGKLLASNNAKTAITYTPTKKMASDASGMLDLAKKLAKYIDKDTDDITERDEKDYWILKNGQKQAYDKKLSDAEQQKYKDEDDKSYKLVLDRIADKDLASLNKKDMQIIAIWRELNQAMVLTPQYVKTGLTRKEAARVGEHLGDLPGIDLATDSERTYPNGHPFFLGNVKPIPKDKLDYYLVRGYDRNDKVGLGYLEQYYEDALNGSGAKLTYVTDKDGEPEGDPERSEGHRGNDMVLTMDMDLQKKVEKILEKNIKKYMYVGNNAKYMDSAYAVVTNPQTGGVLALAGRQYKNGKFKDVNYQTVHNSFAIGSAVKGATVLAGWETGTIPGTINDKPIEFKNARDFSSYGGYGNPIGNVDDIQALEASSNIYMGFIASKLAGIKLADKGGHYKTTFTPSAGTPKLVNAFDTLRDIYSQFGLGVDTQIDFPSEGAGYKGPSNANAGIMPQFAIGQYDTYTPIQMAQYVSTIANGGNRMQLHLMKSIREPAVEEEAVGKIASQFKPTVLNHLSMDEKYINRVHQGFWLVTHGNYHPTASELGQGEYAKYDIAGKTGTAQRDMNGDGHIDTENAAFIGYAPAREGETPEVALSVMVPGAPDKHVNLKIAGDIFKEYFETIGKNK